jgi:hypothetical protein
MRGNEHFIAGAKTRRDHSRRQGVAAAGREHEMVAAEIFGVSRFETLAFTANAVTKQTLRLYYFRDGVDFILADDIHEENPSFFNHCR